MSRVGQHTMNNKCRSRSAPAPFPFASLQNAGSGSEASLSPAPTVFQSRANVATTPVGDKSRGEGATAPSGAKSKRRIRRVSTSLASSYAHSPVFETSSNEDEQRLSEATKARKRSEAGKARRSATITESGKQDVVPKPAPRATKPKSLYNAGLKTVGPEWEVEGIRDSKVVRKTRKYLVKWVGWPESANTWEPAVHLQNATGKIKQFNDRKQTKQQDKRKA